MKLCKVTNFFVIGLFDNVIIKVIYEDKSK